MKRTDVLVNIDRETFDVATGLAEINHFKLHEIIKAAVNLLALIGGRALQQERERPSGDK